MAVYRGRWRMTGDMGVPIGPRPGAMVRQISDDAAPRRYPSRDQREPTLLARISQHGVSGEWTGEDANGNPCVVKQGGGGLEIYAPGEAAGETDQADPEMMGARPPGAASLDALLRRAAPRQVNDHQPDGGRRQIADLQRYLDRFYRDQ